MSLSAALNDPKIALNGTPVKGTGIRRPPTTKRWCYSKHDSLQLINSENTTNIPVLKILATTVEKKHVPN